MRINGTDRMKRLAELQLLMKITMMVITMMMMIKAKASKEFDIFNI